MNWRNPKFDVNGNIDCEIDHPSLGWIPFNAQSNGSSPLLDMPALFTAMQSTASAYVAPVKTWHHAYDSSGEYVGEILASLSDLQADGYTSGAAPVVPLSEQKADKLDALAALRFTKEEAGTTLNGSALATDRVTQSKMTAAYVKATADSTYSIASWKFANGVFSPLDAATIIAAANAIEAHIQACFAREKALSDLIMAAADETALNAIDINTGWP